MSDETENGQAGNGPVEKPTLESTRERIKALRTMRRPDLAAKAAELTSQSDEGTMPSEEAEIVQPHTDSASGVIPPMQVLSRPKPAAGNDDKSAGVTGLRLPQTPSTPPPKPVAGAAEEPASPTGSLVRSMIARIEQAEAAKTAEGEVSGDEAKRRSVSPLGDAAPVSDESRQPAAPARDGLLSRVGQKIETQNIRGVKPAIEAPAKPDVAMPDMPNSMVESQPGAGEAASAGLAFEQSNQAPAQTSGSAAAFTSGAAVSSSEVGSTDNQSRQRDTSARPIQKLDTKETGFFAKFEWLIASRYLRARRKEGFISIIAGFSLVGVALGVATLIIVMSVMTGFRETLIEQILGGNPHMQVTTQTEKMNDFDALSNRIGQVEGITSAWPSVEGQVLASSATGHTGVILRGVRKDDIRKLLIVTDPLEAFGSTEQFSEDNGVAIGQGVADELRLRLGDNITLMTPEGDLTPFGVTPRSKSYPIIYIFRLGQTVFDSRFVYMPLQESQFFLNKKGEADAINLTVADPNSINEYKAPVRRAAQRNVATYSWQDMQGGLIGALDLERNVMFLILALIILVAALNIISGLVMLVKDKAKDVAIMRTMGMSRGSVLRIFFICGASIGVVGAVFGTILGVLFVLNIHPIENFVEWMCSCTVFSADVYGLDTGGLPARLQWSDVIFTLCLALVLSFLATLYPAWKAAKLDPVEALRYE